MLGNAWKPSLASIAVTLYGCAGRSGIPAVRAGTVPASHSRAGSARGPRHNTDSWQRIARGPRINTNSVSMAVIPQRPLATGIPSTGGRGYGPGHPGSQASHRGGFFVFKPSLFSQSNSPSGLRGMSPHTLPGRADVGCLGAVQMSSDRMDHRSGCIAGGINTPS
ncbi:unnamed protein product [Arctogadus glacialis]